MTFDEAIERWQSIRQTDLGNEILDQMKREDLTTKTPEGKQRFADLVDNSCFEWGMF